jgi:hypothetical protein
MVEKHSISHIVNLLSSFAQAIWGKHLQVQDK